MTIKKINPLRIKSSYIGIGISLKETNDNHYPIIVDINTNGPAYRAGLRNGDWISQINNRNTYNEKVATVGNWFNKDQGDANYIRYFDISDKKWKNVDLYNEEINSKR